MSIQTVNLGTAPTGAGGDTFRSTGAKINENFTNPAHAASRLVGSAPGNVMEVGAFGVGGAISHSDTNFSERSQFQGFSKVENELPAPGQGISFGYVGGISQIAILAGLSVNRMLFRITGDQKAAWAEVRHSQNTTVDSNGFIKAASPIVQLFADKITANDEAKLQEITFEKLGVGDYLVKGSLGFAQEGWYVETPKDANGNVLFLVLYDTLENGDISFKTYKKKFDLETASIVADLDKPVDITTGRWIDIRLQELPQPEINHEDLVFESATPPDFQPTNLAQAVAEVFSNGTEQ